MRNHQHQRTIILVVTALASAFLSSEGRAQLERLPTLDNVATDDASVNNGLGPTPSGVAPGYAPPPLTAPANAGEEIILEQGPVWYEPAYWIQPVDWEGSVELGINGADGNAESLSMKTGMDLKRTAGIYTWDVDLTYAKTTANSVETQHNALLNVGVERGFGDSPWSLFGKHSLEYDEFRNFDLRAALNGGVSYKWLDNDVAKYTTRFGAGASREFGGPDNSWAQEAVFGLDYSYKFSKRQKITAKVDYFPEWGDFADYRTVSRVGWEFLLDEENNLSLKLDLTNRYDSTPNGAKPNDMNYSVLLLWKL